MAKNLEKIKQIMELIKEIDYDELRNEIEALPEEKTEEEEENEDEIYKKMSNSIGKLNDFVENWFFIV